MQFHEKKLDLFDFTSFFFAWTFLNFLARRCDTIELIFDGYLLIFIFRRKGDLTLILVRGKHKKFFVEKRKNMFQHVCLYYQVCNFLQQHVVLFVCLLNETVVSLFGRSPRVKSKKVAIFKGNCTKLISEAKIKRFFAI